MQSIFALHLYIFTFGLDNKVGLCYNMPRIKSS